MNILVFNCGSSSLTCKLYARDDGAPLREVLRGKASRVGVRGDKPSTIEFSPASGPPSREVRMDNHRQAADLILDELAARGLSVHAIGHRWPHGGGRFTTALIDESMMRLLRQLVPLIPLHHPATLRVIETCRRRFPSLPQYATTDTAFHADLPRSAYQYALPRQLVEEQGFRKYGFHGLSFQYVTEKIRGEMSPRNNGARMVICHLGTGGAEVDAVRDGRSVDVSTGYTGLTGLMMNTRCGDIDPLLPAWLSGMYGAPLDEVGRILNFHSGLLGITGATSDIRDVLERCRAGSDPRAQLALSMYVRSIRRYIGGFTAALQGIDVLAFTDDVGQRSWQIRQLACAGMEWCGIRIDPDRNQLATGEAAQRIEAADSGVDIIVMPTDEEVMIAREGLRALGEAPLCG